MKKKTVQRIMALIMVLGMACTTAACGNTGADESKPADSQAKDSGSASADSAQTESGGKESASEGTSGETSAERQTVTVMTVEWTAGEEETSPYAAERIQWIEDYCNVDMEINWVLSDVLEEKVTLAMQNPATMPMIMTHHGALEGNLVGAARDGAFVDLSEYIKDTEKYPNLSVLYTDEAWRAVADTLTVDGMLVALPRTRDLGRYGYSYRQDWADKLGLDEPKTVEDVYDMLYAFTYNDPDGNGQDDTFGLEMTKYTGVFDIIQTWFGCGNGWAEVDGKMVPVHMQEEWMDALNWIKKVYEDGLMAQDWYARPTDSFSNACKTGEAGVFVDVMDGGRRIWDYFWDTEGKGTWTASVTNPEEPASMNLLGAINGKTLATSGYNGFFTLSASTCDTPEKVEAALTLLDKLNDNDAWRMAEYGIEGIHWERDENGYMKKLETDDPGVSLNQLLCYLPRYIVSPEPEQTVSKKRQAEVYKENEQYCVINPATAYLANSATYAQQGAALATMIDDARTQYICGQLDEAGLQGVLDQWLAQGGQQIIDEVNAQYEANK